MRQIDYEGLCTVYRAGLATAFFDWIEAFHNRTRRRSRLGMLSPIAYERLHADSTSVA